MVSVQPKIKIEPLAPPHQQLLQTYLEFDGQYRGLINQEDSIRMNNTGIKRFIHDLKKDPSLVSRLTVTVAPNILKRLKPTDKKHLLTDYMNMLKSNENKLVGVGEQRKHKADEIGQLRVNCFKLFGKKLMSQHDFTAEMLSEMLVEKPAIKDMREEDVLNNAIAAAAKADKK